MLRSIGKLSGESVESALTQPPISGQGDKTPKGPRVGVRFLGRGSSPTLRSLRERCKLPQRPEFRDPQLKVFFHSTVTRRPLEELVGRATKCLLAPPPTQIRLDTVAWTHAFRSSVGCHAELRTYPSTVHASKQQRHHGVTSGHARRLSSLLFRVTI